MQTFAQIQPLRAQLDQVRHQKQTVAFVPTMGNLHEGHLTLVREAKKRADVIVVSIFVNPMQFDNPDDLNKYPRTLEADLDKLASEQVDIVFTPTPEIMYPEGIAKQTSVEVPGLSFILEGASRPGHFKGVSTIVTKLFNIVQPNIACFGEKDFQQLAIIRKMVIDLYLPIQIVGVPTIRESDGLAMSSRNNRLTPEQRKKAPQLAQVMRNLAEQIKAGSYDFNSLINQAQSKLNDAGFKTDEIFIQDAKTLETPNIPNTTQVVILMAAFLGDVRLIDNLVLKL